MPTVNPKNMISIFPEFSPIRIKYKDIFDMKEFYDALKEWLWNHQWQSEEGGKEQWETYYAEKISTGGAKEIQIMWRVAKNAPGAGNVGAGKDKKPNLKYYMDFNFQCIGLASTEVIRDGKKIKANKGEMELTIRAFIDPIILHSIKKHSLLKSFANMFAEIVYSGQIQERKKELYQEVYELANFIKQWFKLKRYLPYEEVKSFYPSKAWPSHLKEG